MSTTPPPNRPDGALGEPGAPATLAARVTDRHPSVRDVIRFFAWSHLSTGQLRATSQGFCLLALELVDTIDDCPQLTVALQHLLVAKDAAVRASVKPPGL